jgi:ATP-dependent RNA helicase DHX29
VQYLEDAVELAGWHIDESSPYAVWDRNRKTGAKKLEWSEEAAETAEDAEDDDDKPADPTKLTSSKYSSRTVATVNLLDSRKIPYDLIVRLLERICFEDTTLQPFSAATLVFMPGLAEIRKLHEELQSHPHFGTRDFAIYPLHSSISSEGQSSVFDIPPSGVRKIVISTNIAETGVTIPDITCVIDSGKQREMRYDEKRQLSRLVETYIARSNAKQRRGRAGRVQEGLAFHLFTKARHDNQLAEHPIPEMLRLSLQDLALRIKILKVKMGDTVEEVLLKALDPPSATNIQRAVSALVEVKALTADEEITPMGRLLSKLPMDVHLGKFLLVAALFKCLDPALTIAATLNSKSPFITPFGFESQATAAKRSFSEGNSDFFTIVNVFDTWRRAHDNTNFVRTFCKRNYVSHQNLQQIEELRQQLLAYLIDSSFVEATSEQKQEIARARYSRGFKTRFVNVPAHLNENAANERILAASLASGLYPKILTIDPAGGLRTISNQQPVSIHPSSINFGLPKSEFGSNNLVYYTLMQSKKLYAWETGPIDDRALALLCGDFVDTKLSAASMQIDRKLRFQVEPKSALALKYLRDQLASSMATRLRGRSLSDRQSEWFELALKCIATGVYEDQQTVVVS